MAELCSLRPRRQPGSALATDAPAPSTSILECGGGAWSPLASRRASQAHEKPHRRRAGRVLLRGREHRRRGRRNLGCERKTLMDAQVFG